MEQIESLLKDIEDIEPGRRIVDDPLFTPGDLVCMPWKLESIFEIDDEDLCHSKLKPFACEVPGCGHTSCSLLQSEQHYSVRHRCECMQCHKHLASPHLLDLHLCEMHDSFFAVQAAKQPSYCCFVEECGVKSWDSTSRMQHCVSMHKYPSDFRYDDSHHQKSRSDNCGMEVDGQSVKTLKKSQRGGSRGPSRRGGWHQYTRRQQPPPNTTSTLDLQQLEDALPEIS